MADNTVLIKITRENLVRNIKTTINTACYPPHNYHLDFAGKSSRIPPVFLLMESLMKLCSFERERLISVNDAEYGSGSAYFDWITEEEAVVAEKKRDSLIEEIRKLGSGFDFLGSKTDSRFLSRGCRLCGEGKWSCLFVSGICNGSCFYCPSRQDTALKPSTNTFEFNSPQDYADYVNFFGFKGVSFSGGEPFTSFDLTLNYLKEIRKKCDPDIYVWMYTNGALVREEQLKMLKDEGLNEIRFDIGAFGYSLEKAEMAARHIDTVTVEIPLAPDYFETVKDLVLPMKNAGIKHLNLHQLRVTPYNAGKMIERGYKFVHGKKVTVFKSEINALKVLLHSLKTGGVPVNYCSFLFKSGFQSSATRKRYAQLAVRTGEIITQNGYIRNVAPENGKFAITYFNPVASEEDYTSIERRRVAVFRTKENPEALLAKMIKENSIPENSQNGLSVAELHDIFNFEILHGGFAEYF